MNKQQKMEWILKYIHSSKQDHIDIFDFDFVDAYIKQCNPKKVKEQPYGADSVPELGRLLGDMYRAGLLDRVAIGLTHCHDGYPKWCYSYFCPRRIV